MTDLTIQSLKFQGRKAKAIYAYKATMNDEISFKVDDLITITQCSDDETWLEGTLNSRTGWFPSNYVSLIEQETENNELSTKEDELKTIKNDSGLNENNIRIANDLNKTDEDLRIKNINELKIVEETFLDDMCKFVKIALIPLQANNLNLSGAEILPNSLIQALNSCLDDVINCHQNFFQQLKDIPDNQDAKVGYLFISMAPQFKFAYDSYAKINPKFINAINKNKELIGKYFDLSAAYNKIKSPLMANNSLNASIYISKNLTSPLKQLEYYLKLLKEIHRYTEDFHVDRGDVQRSIEFYSELSNNVQEIRRRKECEIDIMSAQIKNIDEDLFQNGESLFLSSVLVVNESGDKKDRILILFSDHLVILSQSMNSTFEFVDNIPFLTSNNTQLNIQIKKLTNAELIESTYLNAVDGNSNSVETISDTKYCFELIITSTSNRFLVICLTYYDIKMWIDLISNQISKFQFALNNKSLVSKSAKSPAIQPNNSIKKTASCKSTEKNFPVRKHFTMRPHPALIPHFQLPNDVSTSSVHNSLQVLASNESGQVKRFMYKKAKLSEPFGKYHGADDDLKLLNVIESFCKTRVRQSVSVQDTSLNTSGNSNKILTVPRTPDTASGESNGNGNDKCRIESNIELLMNELNENKKSNKELKMMVSNLQKQLETERVSRKKLESFIKKQNKTATNGNGALNLTNDLPNISLINVEHESSI